VPQEPQPTANKDRNRSLERGLEVLRSFRPGTDFLGNGEIAERTGLAKATVSRLCQTLADSGFLARDKSARAYRLAPPILSLAHAMRSGSPVLGCAGPLIRAEAERLKINVGIAVADRDEMVYLESIRYSRKASLRTVVAGQRVPMELTSLGRAWLAASRLADRRALMAQFRARRSMADWRRLASEIGEAISHVHAFGFCSTSWQPEVVAVAAPFRVPGQDAIHVLNMSVTGSESLPAVEQKLSRPLLALARKIEATLGLS